MKRTFPGVLVTASLLTGGLALAQAPSSAVGGSAPPGQQGKSVKVEKGMAEYQGFMAPTDEKALLERLHASNQQEIKQGKLAEKNAQSPDVTSFASMMVKDHTAMDQKLMSYAQGKGLKLSDSPTAMNDMERKMIAQSKATLEELQVLKGAAFDSVYTAGRVSGHDATLGMLMAAKQGLSNPDPQLTAMLQETTQKVSTHREHAYNILGKLPSALGVGGSGSTGGHMGHGSMGHGSTTSGTTTGGTTGPTTGPTTPSPRQ